MICLWFDFAFVTCLRFWWLGFEDVGGGGNGSRCGGGLWWPVAVIVVVGVGSGSGFRFCNAEFWFCSGLGFLIMVVVCGGREWWVGCFLFGRKDIHRERERKKERERDALTINK